MSPTISIDGGWWATLLLLFAVIGIAAWRAGRSPAPATDVGTTTPTPAPSPAPAPAPLPKEVRGSGKPWLGRVVGWSIAIAVLIVIAVVTYKAVAYFLTGGGIPNPRPVATRQVTVQPAPVGTSDPDEQARIEGERHSVAFTYELPPDWIQNPPGYHSNFESQDGKEIDIQCTASPFKPERHTSEAYPCEPGAPTYWWRPVASTPDEGIINVSWRFEKDR